MVICAGWVPLIHKYRYTDPKLAVKSQANIFIDDDCHVRIADFGLTVFSDSTATGTSHRGGSIRWMAPELLYPEYCGFEKYQRTFQSDVYAFACLCLEVSHHLILTSSSKEVVR